MKRQHERDTPVGVSTAATGGRAAKQRRSGSPLEDLESCCTALEAARRVVDQMAPVSERLEHVRHLFPPIDLTVLGRLADRIGEVGVYLAQCRREVLRDDDTAPTLRAAFERRDRRKMPES